MEETQPYEAILEHFNKQEKPLLERDQECEILHSKYKDVLSRRDTIRSLNKTKNKCMNKKIKVVENARAILGSQKTSALGLKEVKQQQNKVCKSRTQNNSLQENKINSLQQTSKDLKELIDNQKQLEIILKKTQEYKRKLQEINEIVHKRTGDVQNVSLYTREYSQKTPQETERFKKKDFQYTLPQVKEYIKLSKQNIRTIDLQVAEIRKQ